MEYMAMDLPFHCPFHNFMDITDVSYLLDSLDHDEVKVFELKQKHAFVEFGAYNL